MNIYTHKGTPTVAFGIMDMRNYSEREIIQKASYYWSGIQYKKCKGCMFHSGDYYLEPFTKELSDIDLLQFMNGFTNEKEIRNRYKYVFVRVIEVE